MLARWTGQEFLTVMFRWLSDSFVNLLAVSHVGFGVSWFLALVSVSLWTCYQGCGVGGEISDSLA